MKQRKLPMKNPDLITLSDHDLKILLYVWKWKVVTTSVLYERFGQEFECGPEAIFKKLKRLQKYLHLKVVPVTKPRGLAWGINDKGFTTIREFLPELKAAGFKSENPNHDLNALAAQTSIQNKVSDIIENYELYTEQELRRVHDGCHPSWVPKNFPHIPDGYWFFKSENEFCIVALETELSKKSTERYTETLIAYNHQDDINSVLWIVEEETLANFILKSSNYRNQDSKNKHHFVLLENLLKDGVDAECFAGTKAGHKLSEFLFPKKFHPYFRITSASLPSPNTHPALDARAYQTKSTIYSNPRKAPDRD